MKNNCVRMQYTVNYKFNYQFVENLLKLNFEESTRDLQVLIIICSRKAFAKALSGKTFSC
jgi:hypothetical protein